MKNYFHNIHQPKNMLITGGAGFIGSHFIRHLIATEPQITIINLDALKYAGRLENLENLPSDKNYYFIKGDITDEKLIHHILREYHIDTIVHFAAETHVDRSIASPSTFVTTNVMGTFVLLEAARRFWFEIGNHPMNYRFHHISTDEVYGSLDLIDPPFTEKSTYTPRSPYSATKAGADHLVRAYFTTYQHPITISHCSNNYGPYQHEEKFIPTVIRSCIQKKQIPIYGQGKNIRDWIYVEDHCQGIWQIIKHGKIGETYHLAGHQEWENLLLAKLICEQLDDYFPWKTSYKKLLKFVTDRAGHDFRYALDTTKTEKELGWTPQVSFESGIKKTIQFYLGNYSCP